MNRFYQTCIVMGFFLYMVFPSEITAQEVILQSVGIITSTEPESTESLCDALVGEETNTEIFPYWDRDGDGLLDSNEGLIPAQGTAKYGDPETVLTWSSIDPPACLQLPYNTLITIETVSEDFLCISPGTATTPLEGEVTITISCDLKSGRFFYRLYLWVTNKPS